MEYNIAATRATSSCVFLNKNRSQSLRKLTKKSRNWPNNLKSDDNSEKIPSDIVDLGLSVKNEKTMVYVSSLIIRNDRLDKKWKEVNDFIKQ